MIASPPLEISAPALEMATTHAWLNAHFCRTLDAYTVLGEGPARTLAQRRPRLIVEEFCQWYCDLGVLPPPPRWGQS